MSKILEVNSSGIRMTSVKSASLATFAAAFLLSQSLTARDVLAHDGLADLSEKLSISVVNILTTPKMTKSSNEGFEFFQNLDPDQELEIPEEFLEKFKNLPFNQEKFSRPSSIGSGFIISDDGYIVTNNHVIQNSASISVELISGEVREAILVGADPKTDIAVIKIEQAPKLTPVVFGNSDKARVGDNVLAIGNPFGHGFSVSAGIISARNRELAGAYDDFIQTDAAINQGNSGGPLFNMDGEVIGVNTAIMTRSGGSIGIGFAMASNVVSGVVDQLIEYGTTKRGWLGVRIQDVTPDMAEALNLASTNGTLVASLPDGPAKEAGIKVGDIIVSLAGQEVMDTRDLVRRVADSPVGEVVQVAVIRDGDLINLDVTLGRREDAEASIVPARVEMPKEPKELLGMELGMISEADREEFGYGTDQQGLIVQKIAPGSAAFEKGIREGDVVFQATDSPIKSVEDLEERIAMATEAGRKSVMILFHRPDSQFFAALPIDD